MPELTRQDLGFLPREVVSDAGYFSEEAIRKVEEQGVEIYCPPEQGKTAERAACPRGRPPDDETFTQRMRRKVRSVVGRAHYGRRKCIVEPVFGPIKQGRGLRQFLMRGLAKVRGEWHLWAFTHNLGKLYRAQVG